jgi:hypothetical protein
MEGYKYNTNDKGIPTANVEAGDNEGIVPRSVNLIYDLVKQQQSTGQRKYTVCCSYL